MPLLSKETWQKRATEFIKGLPLDVLRDKAQRKEVRAKKFKNLDPITWGRLCNQELESRGEKGVGVMAKATTRRKAKSRKTKRGQKTAAPAAHQCVTLMMRAKAVGENGATLRMIQAIEDVVTAKENLVAIQGPMNLS